MTQGAFDQPFAAESMKTMTGIVASCAVVQLLRRKSPRPCVHVEIEHDGAGPSAAFEILPSLDTVTCLDDEEPRNSNSRRTAALVSGCSLRAAPGRDWWPFIIVGAEWLRRQSVTTIV
jgi:hypothetical protein